MKLIPLTQNRFAIVDDEDYWWLTCFRWNHWDGYARGPDCGNGRSRKMHVVILQRHKLWVSGLEVDHRNGCGLDNRKENLRMATRSDNSHNAKHCGATWDTPTGKWRSELRMNGNYIWLGRHRTFDEAVATRRVAEIEHFGEFAYDPLNLCPGWASFCPKCAARAAALLPALPTTLPTTPPWTPHLLPTVPASRD